MLWRIDFNLIAQGDDGSGASRRSRTRSGERSRRTGSKETPRRSRSKDTPRRSASEGGNSDDGGNKRTSRRERRNFVRDRSVSKSRKRRRSGSSDEGERRRRRYERSRSKDREEEELSKVERVARRIAQEEIKSRDGKKWNKVGNQKQYDFNAEVIQNGEELVETLEKEFQGMSCPVPTSVEQIMKKGIEMMTKRNMDLRRADDAGWDAVEMYHRDPLCDTENDEKRWKKAKLEAKEKREKEKLRRAVSRGGGAGGSGVGRGKSKDVYFPVRGMRPLEQPYSYGFGFPSTLYGAGGGRGGGFVPRGGRGWHDSVRRYPGAGFKLGDGGNVDFSSGRSGMPVAEESSRATAAGVASGGTKRSLAMCPMTRSREESPAQSSFIVGKDVKKSTSDIGNATHDATTDVTNVPADFMADSMMKYKQSKTAEEKLMHLEKSKVSLESLSKEDDAVLMFEEDTEIESKVRGTLRSNLGFWEQSGASDFALSVISKGYIPSLAQMPPKYEEPNNASYEKDRSWANCAVQKLATAGLVRKVSRRELACCNPLTVASNVELKRRLCIDLSRCVNKLVDAPKFRIESTREALQVVQRGDWAFAFDLKSAYHQVPLHEDYQKYFGFAIEGEQGEKEYFCYCVMPFGLNDASRVLTKVLKSPLERWRAMGIQCFIHLDDGLSFSSTKSECLRASAQVRGDLQSYGLLISEKKCSWGARQSIRWTGFIWDLKNFKLWVPEEKLGRAEVEVKALKQKVGKVQIRTLAKVVGLLGSFALAMGDIVRFRTRALMCNIARVTENGNWGAMTELGSRERDELGFWEQRLRSLNGYRMRKEDRVRQCASREMFSDASDFFMAGAEFEGLFRKEETSYQTCFGEEERAASSTFRELRAIEEGLEVRGRDLRGSLVRWGCDNWATGVILRVGSMKPHCHEVALRIAELTRRWEIELDPFWISREEPQIREVDKLSKEVDTSDYKLSREDFRGLEEAFGPFSCDMFASSFSYQLKPFVARVACSQAACVDAFSLDWRGIGYMFLHPPVGLVVRVLRYAEQCGAAGLLVVPFWPGAIFMTKLGALERAGKVVLVRRFRPDLISPVWIKSKTFHGPARFDFCVYQLNF